MRCSGSSSWIKRDQKMPNSTCLTCPAHSGSFLPSALYFLSLCTGNFSTHQTLACIVPHVSEIRCQVFDSVFIHAAKRKMDFSVSCYLPGLPFYSSRAILAGKQKSFQLPKPSEGHGLCFAGDKFRSDSVLHPAATLGPLTWGLMAFMMVSVGWDRNS